MEERKKLFSHVTSEEAAKIREEMKKPTRLFSPKDKEEQKNNLISVTNTSKICQNVEINQIQKENTVCNKQEALLAQASIFAQARNPIAETTSVEPSCQMPCNTVTGYSQGIGEKQKKDAFNYDAVSFAYANGYLYALDDRGNNIKIGNFYVEIKGEKIVIDEVVNEAQELIGTDKSYFWEIEVVVGSRRYSGEVEGETIKKLDWIHRISCERAMFDLTSEKKRLLNLYLHQLIISENYKIMQEFASNGWKYFKNGTTVYLTAQGAVGFENLPMKSADRFSLIRSDNRNLQDIFWQFLGMRNVISGNLKNAIALQYYTLTALLTSFYKRAGFQIEFSVGVIGKTNTKKTTCAETFTRIFNRTPSAVPDINFSATEAAIYEVMDKYADQIVLIDDLTPSENDADAREKIKKLENIIRAYGDRVPRRRSISYSSNPNAKEFTPITGCALLTGETFSGGKSSRSRVLILRFEEGDVNNEVLTHYQENLHILPDFVYEFLQYITSNIERVKSTISSVCNEVRRNRELNIKMPRFQDALGVLYSTTNIFQSFIVENGLMDEQSARALLESDREMLLQVIMENDSEVATVSPGVTILEALKFAIDNGKIPVKNIGEIGENQLEKKLLYDDQFFYISAECLWEFAKIYTDYRRIYFPYKKGRDIIECLKNEELLLIRKEGGSNRASHKIVINGKVINQRFLYLNREKVQEIWKRLEQI